MWSASSVSNNSVRRAQQAQHDIQAPPSVVRQTPPSTWTAPTPRSNYVHRQQSTPHRPGLVLDASSSPGTRISGAYSSTSVRTVDSGHDVRKAGRIRPRQSAQSTPDVRFVTPPPKPPAESAPSAVTLARQHNAPLFGFLQKQGSNVPVLKRRFFVLQPGTVLYYFLAPTDTDPRGCLELEGSWIESDNENSCRFSICWEGGRRVVLEARSPDLAEQWKDSLQHERLSVTKAALAKQKRRSSALQSRVKELEKSLETYKLVEQDRDGALEDAAMWKEKFLQLDDSIRMLSGQLRRFILKGKTVKSAADENREGELAEEKKDDELTHGVTDANGGGETGTALPPDLSVLRDRSIEESYSDDENSRSFVPGDFFHELQNTVEQSMENHKLASAEAITAVEDLNAANEKLVSTEKKMAKAEKHLCKLWEENCTLRKGMKQKRREKAVLVREVKALLEAAKEKQIEKKVERLPVRELDSSFEEGGGSDEERLINEVEEHLLSSIRMHEKFLAAGNPNIRDGVPLEEAARKLGPQDSTVKHVETPFDSSLRPREDRGVTPQSENKVFQKNLMSLFDDDSFEEDESGSIEDDELDNSSLQVELSEREDDVASVHGLAPREATHLETEQDEGFVTADTVADLGSNDSSDNFAEDAKTNDQLLAENTIATDEEIPGDGELPADTSIDEKPSQSIDLNSLHSSESSPERKNPLTDLSKEDDEEESQKTSVTHSSRSDVRSGEATSKLACPLADVVDTAFKTPKHDRDQELAHEELQVYHLTFYSRRIGLQFQKVPPRPQRAKGLLTAALTADLNELPTGGEKTAAELRRIAAFSGESDETPGKSQCVVATPLDAVLVCGFNGFDSTGSNVRPKLGARLVAFDGVSVEVGKWTFDSIRKSIQSRGRPLTLSFRNDFLTTEQRQILTKAAQEAGSQRTARTNDGSVSSYGTNSRGTRSMPQDSASVHSLMSGDTDPANGSAATPYSHMYDDDRSLSATSGSDYQYSATPHSFSAPRSVSSGGRGVSFSEAGSSVSVLSAVGPLVSSLLGKREPFTPDYMHREPESVEDTPQHQDFKSELL